MFCRTEASCKSAGSVVNKLMSGQGFLPGLAPLADIIGVLIFMVITTNQNNVPTNVEMLRKMSVMYIF